jgi:OmpA-OmpF porin, OOP family
MPSRPLPAAAAAAALLLLPEPALAQPEGGPYLEAHLGYGFPEQVDVDGEAEVPLLGTLGFDGDIELDDAYVLGGALGYGLALGPGAGRLRLEANVSWRENDLDRLEAEGFDVEGDGELGLLVGLVNAYYDLDLGLPLRPYVGGGVGAARVSVDVDAGDLLDADDEGWAFAWDLAAGLGYEVVDGLELTGGYRYLRVEGTDFGIGGGGELDVDHYASHEVLLGLRYTF